MPLRLLLLILLACLSGSADAQRPNILIIYTDDQRFDEVEMLPNLMGRVAAEGATLSRFYAVTPMCCPARATLLRGQYAHSHGVLSSRGDAQGGWDEWRRRDLGASTLATWVRDAGYRTGFYGKYINGYPSVADTAFVPPGWDDWLGGFMRFTRGSFFGWKANDNGRVREWGDAEEDYRTDVEGERLTAFAAQALDDGQPFFAVFAPLAPHAIGASEENTAIPPIPAPRHLGLLDDLPAPRRPSYDEADVSDKNRFINNLPRLTADQRDRIDTYYRRRVESLLSVDDVLGRVMDLLEARDALDNTYIVFASDNGFQLGEHRLPPERKGLAYEEDVRLPAYVRGPGVRAGGTIGALTSNLDLASTIAEWAGAEVPDFVEGRSFAALLEGADAPWRTGLLIERWLSVEGVPEYFRGVVTERYKLVRWTRFDGFPELYDLDEDPYEMTSVAASRVALRDSLDDVMAALALCRGADCRVADRLWPAPVRGPGADTLRAAPGVVGPYPNPARDAVHLRLTAETSARATIRVLDARGRVVRRLEQAYDARGVTVRISTAGLAPGAYTLELRLRPGGQVARRFVVRR